MNASTRVMLFSMTTARSRLASVLNSLGFCFKFIGHGNILSCSSTLSSSFPASSLLIQRGSEVRAIFNSSSIDDKASSNTRDFSSSKTRPPLSSGKSGFSGSNGMGIMSVQLAMGSSKCLGNILISKSKEGGKGGGDGPVGWKDRLLYRQTRPQKRSSLEQNKKEKEKRDA